MLVSPEENGLLARIERQLGQRLPRQHVEDFDYGAVNRERPTGLPVGKPKSNGGKVFEGTKKKAYRGQGRR